MTKEEARELKGTDKVYIKGDDFHYYFPLECYNNCLVISPYQGYSAEAYKTAVPITEVFTKPQPNQLTNTKMSTLTEKFALALTSEPNKSFRKAGITNGDNILTDEGVKVFLTWLLKANQDAFKKEVVDDILKEMESEKE